MEHYGAMQRYMAFLDSKTDPETGRLDEGPLGDWLSPEGSKNDNTLLWTAYQVRDLEIMGNIARILGKAADAEHYVKRYAERREYFNNTYVDKETGKTIHSGYEGRMFGPPPPGYKKPEAGTPVDTQASYAIPLHFGVFQEDIARRAAENLTSAVSRENRDDLGIVRPPYSLMTGFIGTASLNPALSEAGKDTYAYRLLQQQSYPSWLYSVVNGATTIWERLNSYTEENGFGGNNSMNSFNHYSFGAVAAWMYNYSLGIQRDISNPGFRHFILKPAPDPDGNMTWAKGYYDSMYGRIGSSWKLEGGATTYKLSIPPNTTATLFLKTPSARAVTESGKPLKKAAGISMIQASNGAVQMHLGSGEYEFRVEKNSTR
jgi:alpha-L-rhamnosidase